MNVLSDSLYPLINEVHWKLESWGITERVGLLGESLASAAKSIGSLVLAVLAGTAVGVTSGQFEKLNHHAVNLRNTTLKNAYLSFATLVGALVHPNVTGFILGSKQKQPLENSDPTVVLAQAYQLMLSRPRSVGSQ